MTRYHVACGDLACDCVKEKPESKEVIEDGNEVG
jgi:hypothetical protein